MTEKGKDYKTVYYINNKVLMWMIIKTGDVVLYSSKTVHGVLDVDPKYFPDLNSTNGRYVALTTLFKW